MPEVLNHSNRGFLMKIKTVLALVGYPIFFAVAVQILQAQTNPAAPAAAPAVPARGGFGGGMGGMGGPGRGPAVATISTNAPGMPGVPMPDPAVGRKAKWPVRDAVNSPPEGLTARSPQNNGFYRRDAQGNIVLGTDLYLWAPSGHFSNYDQDDLPPYSLPDPLVMKDGRRVTSAEMWYKERRPELINLFKDNIYGRVPEDKLPKIIWEVRQDNRTETTINKTIIGYFEGTTPPPTNAATPGPGAGGFGGGGMGGFGRGGGGGNTITINLTLPNVGHPVPVFSGGPVNDPQGHGWGTFSVSGNAGVVARISPPAGQPRPGNFPGNYAVTGWAFSRAIDYLVTDKDVDAAHITIAGMSTGGKQVLYTAATDDRIWCVVPESSGAMGVKLSRRDVGETIDDLASGNFAGNYCPNFTNYIGHWNDMPVDQHEMIALMAPRKMFLTGGNQENWQDVKGGFLAAVAAEPVYMLLGKKGINTVEMPPIERPIVFGEIGFYQHNGAHTFTANERAWITAWMEQYLPKSPAK
jgi:hypothetical protein